MTSYKHQFVTFHFNDGLYLLCVDEYVSHMHDIGMILNITIKIWNENVLNSRCAAALWGIVALPLNKYLYRMFKQYFLFLCNIFPAQLHSKAGKCYCWCFQTFPPGWVKLISVQNLHQNKNQIVFALYAVIFEQLHFFPNSQIICNLFEEVQFKKSLFFMYWLQCCSAMMGLKQWVFYQ